MTLIPIEDLRRAEERYFAARAEELRKRHQRDLEAARDREQQRDLEEQREPQEVHLAGGIRYQVRSELQWEARAHQSFDLRIGEKRRKARAMKPAGASPAVAATLAEDGVV
jgi:hypothetical protein